MNRTPYPGKHESHESWMRRCDNQERQDRAENEARYDGSPDSRGLTDRQRAKLKKVEAKLPQGWFYWVTNDNEQIGVRSETSNGDIALATKTNGRISAQVYADGVEGAKHALLLNRACAAVWGQQPVWATWDTLKNEAVSMWPKKDWVAAQKELR